MLRCSFEASSHLVSVKPSYGHLWWRLCLLPSLGYRWRRTRTSSGALLMLSRTGSPQSCWCNSLSILMVRKENSAYAVSPGGSQAPPAADRWAVCCVQGAVAPVGLSLQPKRPRYASLHALNGISSRNPPHSWVIRKAVASFANMLRSRRESSVISAQLRCTGTLGHRESTALRGDGSLGCHVCSAPTGSPSGHSAAW